MAGDDDVPGGGAPGPAVTPGPRPTIARWRPRLPSPQGAILLLSGRLLLRDKLRLAISVGGLAFAVLLVLLLRGIMDGTVAKSTSYVDNVGADLFVAGKGVSHMSLSSSSLPQTLVSQVSASPGVARAAGIIRVNIVVGANGNERPAQLIGYDTSGGFGGPWHLDEGRPVLQDDEAVLDSVLAGDLGLQPGGSVALAGSSFTVVGLSSGTAAIAGKLLFISLPAAQRLLHTEGFVSFVLVALPKGTEAAPFATSLAARLPETAVLTRSTLSRNDRDLLGSLFVEPVNMTSTIGFLVGLAIVGLTMYTSSAERLRDFGVLKAIGAPNGFLMRAVILQAAVLGLAGFGVGLGAAWVAGPLVENAAPDLGIIIRWDQAARVLGAVVGMALVGAVIPLVRIMRVDPLIVFRR